MPGLQRVISSRHSSGAPGNPVGTSWQASCLTYRPTSKCTPNGDKHPFAPRPLGNLGNNAPTFHICPSSDAPKAQAGAHLDAEVRRVQRGRRAHQGAQLARLARRRTLLLDRQQLREAGQRGSRARVRVRAAARHRVRHGQHAHAAAGHVGQRRGRVEADALELPLLSPA